MAVDMDDIYQKMPLESIPWNSEAPPELLIRLVESKTIVPCRAIDLGCGAGNYAIWLAGKGFDVTGVDLSPTAIEIARKTAAEKGVRCHFVVGDLLGDLSGIQGKFDFAYDWEVLHHIFPKDRERYLGNVDRLLNSGGKYLSVCFNEADPQFGGRDKYRKTRLGTELYFSSVEELKALFRSRFKVIDLRAVEISGKFGPHVVNYALVEK